jgi:hypothetical protein
LSLHLRVRPYSFVNIIQSTFHVFAASKYTLHSHIEVAAGAGVQRYC